MKRKIIGISTGRNNNGETCTTALCDDGTIWIACVYYDHEKYTYNTEWERLPDIPQDEGET